MTRVAVIGSPPDCPMWPMTLRLARLIWRLHRNLRPRLLELFQQAGAGGTRVVHLRSPAEMRRFLSGLAAETP